MKALACLLLSIALSVSAAEPGFQSLFNGKDLTGWEQVAKRGSGYIVENGLLVCPPDGGGNIFTTQDFSDFVFRFEFRMEPGGNNGVGIRAPLTGDVAYSGMEIQILDHDHERYKGRLKPTQYHGSIYDVFPAEGEALKPAGEWNEEEIMADGRRIKVTLNGKVLVDANLDSITDPAVLKKHPGLARTSGHIGFLGHGTRVEFRNLRIKELP